MKLHTSELDQFKEDVNKLKMDAGHPDILAKYSPLTIDFDTPVDESLCPFSDEYFAQQVALYEEISGRRLNQTEGELHLANEEELISSPNPLGIRDAAHMSEYSRAILGMLSVADLPGNPRVLDMGAGHGVSSELFAFCGCDVEAVDIDPGLGNVARVRAENRNYSIRRHDMNFDDVAALPSNSYSAAFFYQSLHHCLRPWELIAELRTKLHSDGVIAFAGEPLQSFWWKHWGLRLDIESVYVARQFGWFESGWSYDFISQCFARNGMELLFFTGGLKGGEIGIASADSGSLARCRARAEEIGLIEVNAPFGLTPDRYLTQLGTRSKVVDRPGFCQTDGATGFLMYGPYADLPAGRYKIALIVSYGPTHDETSIALDMVSSAGSCVHWAEELRPGFEVGKQIYERQFEITEPAQGAEIRAHITGARNWAVSIPFIRRI